MPGSRSGNESLEPLRDESADKECRSGAEAEGGHGHRAAYGIQLQRRHQENGVDEAARHPSPYHTEGKCTCQRVHWQKPPAERCDSLPELASDTTAGIAQASERDECSEQERQRG